MRSRRDNAWVQWGVFLGVAALLSVLVWAGWSVINHRSMIPFGDAGTEDATTVKVGVTDMPESLDIRPSASSEASEAAADPTAIDTVSPAERLLIGNVYETLVTVDQQNRLQPGLATKWTVANDGLTYTLTIAKNVTFSNGHTLDAADVVWSLQQAVNGQAASQTTNQSAGNSISNSDTNSLGSLASVTNPDATTVVITLNQPNPTLLRTLSGKLGVVFDAEADGTDYAAKAVGSGPFIVRGFRSGQSLTLARNDEYHGTKAASAAVTVTKYDSDAALVKALQNGDIELAQNLGADAAASLQSESAKASTTNGITVTKGATTSKVMLAYNHGTDSLLSDEQARKAFRYQIDAAGITGSQADSDGALGGPISPLESGYEDLTGLFPYDTAQAQSMFGYFGDQYLTTVNLVVTERWRTLAETIKQQIEQGPRPSVNLEVLSDADYAARIQTGTWEMTLMSMDGTDDAGLFVDGNGPFHYDRAEAQQAYASARAATNDADYAERMKTYARLLSEDAAADWLYTRACFTAARSGVSGYPTALTDQRLPLANVRIG
ncbi:ABC transporter substrate-binding protein [Bifidobacterium sp. SO4]|uniref:ABC transporter substrate-binding protein n=1 Tax=Bifidobacterium sp. SO4 TaxID=2809030 RepID=UPI001BDC9476|nr:ABC transporter substrate-binding protein [Bifidobacterium sp. SO4]MBT1171450.1 ABC transporter substrate-binding protein [Bifidobacterium sp. SO4]